MRKLTARADLVLIQAVIAGALSFAHLHDLSAAAGQDGWKAWAYPVSVDLLLVAAWRKIRTVGTGSAWCWFLIALAASLGANIATAGLLDLEAVPDWLRILVAGWPGLAFLGGTLLAHTTPTASKPDPAPDTTPVPAPAPAPDRVTVEQVATPDPDPAPVPVPVPDGAVELPAAPAPEPAPAPAVELPSVPPALVAHAKKFARDHHALTGSPVDQATLARRLGLPAPVAAAVHAQLT